MSKLTAERVKQSYKLPPQWLAYEQEQIEKHDSRCKFHVEPTQDEKRLYYYKSFLSFVNTIIDEDKQKVFKHLLTLPIETVDFMEGVLNELKKIFESQNRNISFQFNDPELIPDYQAFLEKIGDETFWRTKGFNAMKSSINQIIICDLPKAETDDEGNIIQGTRFPEPYYYLLPACNVVDIDYDSNLCIEWIIFKDVKNKNIIHAFDDEKFMTFEVQRGVPVQIGTDIPHDIGWCPAVNFWSIPFNSESKLQRRAPISNSLGKLDWLLALMVFQKHNELYAGFPIYIMYEQRCTYKDDGGNFCDGGIVRMSVKVGNTDQYRDVSQPCPLCSNSTSLGAGKILTAPARSANDEPDLLQGVHVVPAEQISLEYLQKRVQIFEASVVVNTIGLVREPSKEAMNELQIQSGYESRTNVLLDVKGNFERAHKFVIDTLGRMRYGDLYIGSVVFYGDKFYLYDASDLLEAFDKSKTSGAPMFELSSQFDQVIQTRYRNNPEMIERYSILYEVEPFPLVSMKELKDQKDVYLPTNEELIIKSRFDQLIKRFENEFQTIAYFMPLAAKELRIEFIRETIKGYVEELLQAGTPPPPTAEPAIV